MEFMVQWFWIFKLMGAGALAYSIYRFMKSGFKSKSWLVLSIIGLVLMIVSPVKLETNTRVQQVQNNEHIKSFNQKLPPKVIDNSFKEHQKDIGITNKDLE